MRQRFLLIIALLLAFACEPETIPVSFEQQDIETKAISLNIHQAETFTTKSSFPSDIETKFSGAILAIYDSITDDLVKIERINSISSPYRIWLPMNKEYDFFLLANLWKINKQTLSPEPIDIPNTAEEMKALAYRIDGGSIDDTYRRENFHEISEFGIPMCWSEENLNSLTVGRKDIVLDRLFAKLVLTIDHRGISGTKLEDFVNGTVHIKQINNKLTPFGSLSAKAVNEEDIIPIGDYESSIENALVKELVFYVPENAQAELLPENTEPRDKDVEHIESVSPGKSSLATYLEFQGNISSAGVSAKATYRFFLGSNSTSNFDVFRNELYEVELSFNAESVFCPEWKIHTENFSDTRQFFLSGSLAGQLPDGKVIVVRKNRAAQVDLNMKIASSYTNNIGNLRLVDSGYMAENLRDLAWTSDFYSATHNAENEPQRQLLRENGMDVSYNNGTFSFSVIDESKFQIGKSIPISLTLFPGHKTINAVIKTGEDIVVQEKDGKSLVDLLIAQKRCIEISGFEGNVYYAAEQEANGHSAIISSLTDNYQWKTSAAQEASFPTVYKNGDSIIYPYQNPALYSLQKLDKAEDLDIYTYWPNHWTNILASGTLLNKNGHIIICSDDVLNDGVFDLEIRVDAPYITHISGQAKAILTLDGYEETLSPNNFHIFNSLFEPREELSESDFEPILYDRLLKPKVEIEAVNDWASCIQFNEESNTVAITRTTIGTRKIEEELANKATIATIKYIQNNTTGLFANNQFVTTCTLAVPYFQKINDADATNYFNTESTNSVIRYRVKVLYDFYNRPTFLEYSERGPKMSAELYGRTFEPKTETKVFNQYNADYSNLKAEIWYEYYESHQELTYNSRGVLGGLLVPYGRHQFVAKTVNRWDNREIEFTYDYDITYELNLIQCALFWDHNPYAGILLITPKNKGYILRNFHIMDPEYQAEILKVLGTNVWNERMHYSDSYHYMVEAPKLPQAKLGLYQNFDVKYFDPSAIYWTSDLMRKCAYMDNYIWLGNLCFLSDENEYVTSTTDPVLCGHESITKLTIISDTNAYGRAVTSGLAGMVD